MFKVSLWPRGRGLGGSTLLNGLVYIRGSRHDYDLWERNGCDGWGYDDVLPYFLKSENMRTTTGIDKGKILQFFYDRDCVHR